MWETMDPDGRRVTLTFGAWRHIVQRHSELERLREAILATVAHPSSRRGGHEANEEWFYGTGFGPAHFVRVVVHFRGQSGRIITAFPRRRLP